MVELRRRVTLALFTSLCACSQAGAAGSAPPSGDGLLAVAWVQTAAEYEAAALQVFGAARGDLQRVLADRAGTAALEQTGDFSALPPVIIVDVDETVLDNSAYQARLIASGGEFEPSTWGAWIEERKAKAIPGAVEFLGEAAKAGVRVFYVSNRDAGQAEATRDNLARLGFPDADDLETLYFKDPEKGWKDKHSRRAEVCKTHRVIFVFGDNLFDFVERDKPDLAARRTMVRENTAWWGTRWFMLPNPMYGSWDDALVSYERSRTAAEKRSARQGALDAAQ